jgi:hypothetical protein
MGRSARIGRELMSMETSMRMRLPKNLAVAAIATLAGFTSLTGARAMPIAMPSAAATVQDAFSGEAVASRSGLIEDVRWRGGRGWHRGGWHRGGWHGRRWHRRWR